MIDECKACIGFLEMRKSDFVKNLGDKLACFKSGRNKLEQEILKEPDNVSFRFLRFIIQEHAPKIVNYHADMNNDLTKIKLNYKMMKPYIQQAIIDYSKQSRNLKL